ncbi:MAG: gliding motility-associated C-terminal domain-containing protein, partial [Flavobacteriales bacterium]
LFDPGAVSSDTAQIIFATTNVCITPDTLYLPVDRYDAMSLNLVEPLCADAEPIQLQASTLGGTWDGVGIVDSLIGLFDPGVALAGTHNVGYVLPGACLESTSVQIDVIDPNALVISAQPAQVCQDAANVVLQTNQPGGTWTGDGVSTNGTFNPGQVQPGPHNVYYQIQGVCNVLDSLTIQVLDTALSITPVAPRCIDQGSFNLSASQPGGYWTGQGITNQVTGLFNPMSIGLSGTYVVQYQIPGVCPLSEQASVVIEDYPDISFTFDSVFCDVNQAIVLSATPVGGIWGGDANALGLLDPLGQAGDYDVSYTTGGACNASSNTSVHVAATPVVSINAPNLVCPNDEFTLTASGAVSYNWSPSANLSAVLGAEVIGQLTTSTLFEVVGMNDSGCLDTAQWEVEPYAVTAPMLGGDSVVCNGSSAMLQVSGISAGWQWQLADSYDAMNDAILFTPSANQTVTVQGLDEHDCLVSDEIQVILLAPQANLSPVYQDVSLPEEAYFENLGQGSSFHWSFGNGDSLVTTIPDAISYAYSTQDTFLVVLTAIEGACTDTAHALVYAHFVSSVNTIPNIITLNADGLNDSFRVDADYLRELHVQFYDRWGHHLGGLNEVNGAWTPPTTVAQVIYYTLKATGLDDVEYAAEGSIQVTVGNVPEE